MPRSNLRLFVICPKEGSYFFDKVFQGIEKAHDELKQSGVRIEYLYTKYHNVSRQIQLLTQAIDLKPDGIAIVPASTTELNLLIDEAVESNIPVITFNNDAPYSKRLCYVGPDNYASGRLCGELMGNFLSLKGNLLIFSASNEVYGLKQRLLGFKDKVKSSYPEIKILKIIDYADDEEICYSLAMQELSENKDINGIFTTSATGSMAIGKALKNLNQAMSPVTIGFDPNDQVSQYVFDGLINTLIYQDPFTQGYMSIKVLYDYLSSGLVPEKESFFTRVEIVMRENIENFIQNSFFV